MSHKYHINANGDRKPCTATKRACQYAPADTAEQELQARIHAALGTGGEQKATLDLITTREELDKAVEDKRIIRSRHPKYPVSIYKYSRTTQFGHDWDNLTLQARGLIVHDETNEILARPFRKFFNIQEPDAPTEGFTGPFSVTEKLDGSLGVLWTNPDGQPEVSTSGGFRSQQTGPATKLYMDNHHGNWTPDPEYTYLYEIILPNNRIVVDYGDRRELVLLGAVNKKTGISKPINEITEWNGPRAEVREFNSLQEVLDSPDVENEEGHIIHWHNTDERVKVKLATYLSLHRNLTGVTTKHIWEKVRDEQIDEWRKQLPEEFDGYVSDVLNGMHKQSAGLLAGYEKDLGEVLKNLPANPTNREVHNALQETKRSPKDRGVMLSIFQYGTGERNRHLKKELWKMVRPEHDPNENTFFYNKAEPQTQGETNL